jgi:hypothetical protein
MSWTHLWPGGLMALVLIGLMVWAAVIYALHSKGDVRVHISRGKTSFELDAKEASGKR